jgi:hypothetical protein
LVSPVERFARELQLGGAVVGHACSRELGGADLQADQPLSALGTASSLDLRRLLFAHTRLPRLLLLRLGARSAFAGLLLFLVPGFVNIFKQLGGDLPKLTQYVVNVSDLLKHRFYIIFPGFGASIFGFRKWKRRTWDASSGTASS